MMPFRRWAVCRRLRRAFFEGASPAERDARQPSAERWWIFFFTTQGLVTSPRGTRSDVSRTWANLVPPRWGWSFSGFRVSSSRTGSSAERDVLGNFQSSRYNRLNHARLRTRRLPVVLCRVPAWPLIRPRAGDEETRCDEGRPHY